MAINFPSSPSVNDTVTSGDVTWTWNGSSWEGVAGVSGIVYISESAPVSPVAGDLWWNSSTGSLKVYYDDGSSAQWVDASPSGSAPAWDADQNILGMQVFS
jgi:hypothetical protein